VLAKESCRVPAGQPAKTIWLVRHGKTVLNSATHAEDRIRGWLDVNLDEEGYREATRLAAFFVGKGIAKIVCSDFNRAAETARVISEATGVPIAENSKDLRPWNVGVYQGQLSQAVHPILEEYARNKPDVAIEGGESFNEFKRRYLEHLDALMRVDNGPLLIVSHYRNLKLAEAWIEAGAVEPVAQAPIDMELFFTHDLGTGAVLQLDQNAGKWSYAVTERPDDHGKAVEMADEKIFCATGPGGGRDPTCRISAAEDQLRVAQAKLDAHKEKLKKLQQAVRDAKANLKQVKEQAKTAAQKRTDGRKAKALDAELKPWRGEIRAAMRNIHSEDVTFEKLNGIASRVGESLQASQVVKLADEIGVLGSARTKKDALEQIRVYLQNQKRAVVGSTF
jgi:broad specificity phosphatase PhoE